MAKPVKKSAGAKRKVMPNQGIGSASSRVNKRASAGQRKAAPARSNAGGAIRGKARAASVRKSPISITISGKTTSITGSRSVSAQAIRRGKQKAASAAAAAKPQAASAGAPSAAPKAQLQDYAGNPVKFLGDFFSGGAFRKR